ncbi:ABC transporter permease [Cellulomonas sp. JZ18]|uniref:ABC transporter permease n=1 Tax=Cellulomonas sp. JZ18 TaxID=2654191 RepID=UPI0012D3DC48|nr:ABC transporter permease [Cellulomonas sp. JZ18]QGQ18259.1 ABC transporter permease [Cellulomonas sp. JZ18]
MTTTTAPRPTVPAQRRALARMTLVEGRLLLRDPSVMFFSLLFPALLLTVLGLAMPWADEPYDSEDPFLSQISGITGYTSIVLSLAIATVALSTYPATIATYRQRGVLRRLSTTPVGPGRLLVAQVLVNLVALLAAAALAVTVGLVVLDVSAPSQPLLLLGVFVLAVLAVFAMGSLVAALAPTAAAANGWGMTLYFVSLFFAGVWLPLPIMPDVVQDIATWLPLGAASQAMTAAWVGQPFPTTQVLVLAAWTLLATPVAARLFRWS